MSALTSANDSPDPLTAWISRQLDRLEALNAQASNAHWRRATDGSDSDGFDVLGPLPSTRRSSPVGWMALDVDADLTAAARNVVPGFLALARQLLETHWRCTNHGGCSGCNSCSDVNPATAWPCQPVRQLAATFADHFGYRPEWRPHASA